MKIIWRNELINNLSTIQYSFLDKNIKIVVAGVSSKVVTTTTAFNLTNFIYSIGGRVSDTEVNSNVQGGITKNVEELIRINTYSER